VDSLRASFELGRLESLEARQLASRSAFEAALRTHRVTEAALQEARAGFTQAERDLARTEIKAPFTGLVRRESVDIGQFVSRGNSVATLYASAQAEVRLPIADRQLAFLNLPVGIRGELPPELQPAVTLSAEFAGQQLTWRGRIVRTEAQIDTMSRMVHVVARVENTEQAAPLAVGLFVNAEIEGLTAEDVVVLPRSALRGGKYSMSPAPSSFSAPLESRMTRESILHATRNAIRVGRFALIRPVITLVDGLCVAKITWIPTARDF